MLTNKVGIVVILKASTTLDSVIEVVDLAESEVELSPSIGASPDIECIRGMGKVADDFVILLNLGKIFSGDEFELLQKAEELKK